jgi:hypothetical protein
MKLILSRVCLVPVLLNQLSKFRAVRVTLKLKRTCVLSDTALSFEMKNLTILLLTLVSVGIPALAQVDIPNQDIYTTMSQVLQAREFASFDKQQNVIGSPTLFTNFLPGKMLLVGARRSPPFAINLDAYNDQVLFINGSTTLVAPVEKVDGFVVKDPERADSIVFTKLSFENEVGFFRVLAKHKNVALYRKHIKVLQRPVQNNGYNNARTETLVVDHEELVLWNGNTLAAFRTKKQLLQYFPEYKDQLEQFIIAEQIDLKNDDDLIRLFNKIGQLKQ